ncbi:FAD-dependent oxidoreductase [Patescibacteria group bacterium]|nr:FAD-dependent oxidoreductase [Patescibacteria group bacterium]
MTEDKDKELYDCLIIGGGPAGFTAGIYAARYKLKTILFTKEMGGTSAKAHKVENYPGFSSIAGIELMQKFREQYEEYDVELQADEVKSVRKGDDGIFTVMADDREYKGRAVVLALGKKRRELGVPGEKEFAGKGVSYCATCDGMFFTDKVTAVVGGSDAAVMAALLLSPHAEKVYLIYRRDQLRAEPIWTERVVKDPKVEIIYNTNVVEVKGEGTVKSVMLDKEHEGSQELALDGLFIEVGADPEVSLAKELGVELDEKDRIKINTQAATNVPGVSAAGDVTVGLCEMEQIVTAAAEGATAAYGVYEYLLGK